MVAGPEDNVNRVERLLGNSVKRLDHPNVGAIFLGILVGIVFGSIPFQFPGMATPLKLGLAGGPLINARSSAVTGTRSTMLLVRFAIRSPSFPFPIRVWDYPNKQTRRHPAGRAGALFGSVATLPMLAAVSLFSLLLR